MPKIYFYPILALVMTVSLPTSAQVSQQNQSVTVNLNVNAAPYTNYGPSYSGSIGGNAESYYYNLLDTCARATENLMYTMALASDHARAGNFKAASGMLHDALIYEAGLIGRLQWAPFPHSALAIAESAYIAADLKQTIAKIKIPPPQTPPPPAGTPAPPASLPPAWFPPEIQLPIHSRSLEQVEYVVLQQLYSVINQAYGIDARWYRSLIVPRCYSNWAGCYSHGYYPQPYWLPAEYFDGVRELTLSLLKAQQATQTLQYADAVELSVAKSTVRSAKAILTTALYRRDMICSIRELHMLEARIGYIQSGSSSLTSRENIGRVRSLLGTAINNLASVCFRGYPDAEFEPYGYPGFGGSHGYPGYPGGYVPPQSPGHGGQVPPPYPGPGITPSAYTPVEAPYVDRFGHYRVDIRDTETLDRVLSPYQSTTNER